MLADFPPKKRMEKNKREKGNLMNNPYHMHPIYVFFGDICGSKIGVWDEFWGAAENSWTQREFDPAWAWVNILWKAHDHSHIVNPLRVDNYFKKMTLPTFRNQGLSKVIWSTLPIVNFQ